MRSIAVAVVFLFTVFIIAVAIMFAVALGIIIAYEYLKKGGKNDTKSNESAKG